MWRGSTACPPSDDAETRCSGNVPHRPIKPVIAAVTGACEAEGLVVLGRVTTVRVAGVSARFGFGPHAVGTGVSVRSRLHKQIPYTALAWMIAGHSLDAAEAARVGLVTETVADDVVLDHALVWATKIAKLSPLTVVSEHIALLLGHNAPDVRHYRPFFYHGLMFVDQNHPDILEAFAAFPEKREPNYKGFAHEMEA
jgi:enoyl-CoA hydratase/carnithine racemase